MFVERCRTRNPVVVASRSGLVLLEVDGPLELLERFGIELPETVCVRSARGWHFWFTPPPGEGADEGADLHRRRRGLARTAIS